MNKEIYEDTFVDLKVRLSIFNAVVVANALYGCEIWNTTAQQIQRVETQQLKLLRRLFNVRWGEKMSIVEMMAKAAKAGVVLLPIEVHIRRASLRYAGHVIRTDEREQPLCLQANMFTAKLAPKQAPDAQPSKKQTYGKSLKTNLKNFGILTGKQSTTDVITGKVVEIKCWSERPTVDKKQTWARDVNVVGVEKCMDCFMTKKRAQKYGRERKLRAMDVDQDALCECCELKADGEDNDMVFCDGYNLCYHFQSTTPKLSKPNFKKNADYFCAGCKEAEFQIDEVLVTDQKGITLPPIVEVMKEYDKMAKEVIEKRKQINASAEALKKAKKKLKKEMTKMSGLALALERAEAKRKLTEEEKAKYDNKSKKGKHRFKEFKKGESTADATGKDSAPSEAKEQRKHLTPHPQSPPPNIPTDDDEKNRKRAREDYGDVTEKTSKSGSSSSSVNNDPVNPNNNTENSKHTDSTSHEKSRKREREESPRDVTEKPSKSGSSSSSASNDPVSANNVTEHSSRSNAINNAEKGEGPKSKRKSRGEKKREGKK